MENDVKWVKYMWELPGQVFESPLAAGYRFRVGRQGEEPDFIQTTVSAYASDATWEPMINSIRQRMTDRVMQTYGDDTSEYFCVLKNDQIIAVSGMAETHWTEQNFLTGPCVLPDHQRKGLGLFLLAVSLSWLRDRGLQHGIVFTEEGSIADTKVYPNFRPRRIVGVAYIDPPKTET